MAVDIGSGSSLQLSDSFAFITAKSNSFKDLKVPIINHHNLHAVALGFRTVGRVLQTVVLTPLVHIRNLGVQRSGNTDAVFDF